MSNASEVEVHVGHLAHVKLRQQQGCDIFSSSGLRATYVDVGVSVGVIALLLCSCTCVKIVHASV